MHKSVSISSSISAHYILAYNEAEDVKHVFVTSKSIMMKLWKMTCIQLPKVSVFTWNTRKFPLQCIGMQVALTARNKTKCTLSISSNRKHLTCIHIHVSIKLQLNKNVWPLFFPMFWLTSYLNTVSFQFLNHTWGCFDVRYMFDTPTY